LREAKSSCDEALQVELHAKIIPAGTGQQSELSLGLGCFFVCMLSWLASKEAEKNTLSKQTRV